VARVDAEKGSLQVRAQPEDLPAETLAAKEARWCAVLLGKTPRLSGFRGTPGIKVYA